MVGIFDKNPPDSAGGWGLYFLDDGEDDRLAAGAAGDEIAQLIPDAPLDGGPIAEAVQLALFQGIAHHHGGIGIGVGPWW